MKLQTTLVDLSGCDERMLGSEDRARDFCYGLCDVINMKPYGEPIVDTFGEGNLRGVTAIQRIETSDFVVHFDEQERRVFVTIESCKEFDAVSVWKYCKSYFKTSGSR